MGFEKKRLTTIQTSSGSAHFFRTWSESALRPPQPASRAWEGPPPCMARFWGHVSGRAYRAPSPGRSPTRVSRQRRRLAGPRRPRAQGRASASRMVPAGRPPGAPSSRYGRWRAGHGTRERGHGTRKRGHGTRKLTQATRRRPGPSPFARPRPPQAGPRRLQPPAALFCPPRRARGAPSARPGKPPRRTTLGAERQSEHAEGGAASRPTRARAAP